MYRTLRDPVRGLLLLAGIGLGAFCHAAADPLSIKAIAEVEQTS
jgi:hypothetical protein